MPQSNQHKCYTNSNNISSCRRKFSVSSPTCWIIDITNFHYFQIVNTSKQSINQSNCNCNQQSIVLTPPQNSSLSLESINRWQTCLTCHKNPPPKSSGCRTLIQAFQVPNKLRTCCFKRWLIWSSHWCHNLSPCSKVNQNVDKHVSPKSSNRIRSRSTQRHQQQTHMTNTTISKQSFQCGLCQRSQCSNNHRKNPKKSQSISKRPIPQILPIMCPESKNRNFRQYCNPQRNTGPSSCVYIRYPKMQRSGSLFPEKTHAYKPNSLKQKQIWFSTCPKNQTFNMTNGCFSSLPIKKTNSLQKQTTPKCTKQEIFHRCFNRISTFIVQSTQNNQRKTLQFKTQIHRHLICCLNKQILTHECLHCQIDIFSMPNSCCFLPSQRNPLDKSCCEKQNSTLLHTIIVFLKRTSQKNTLQRTIKSQNSTKQTPLNSPQTLSRCCMIRSCSWPPLTSKSSWPARKASSAGGFATRPFICIRDFWTFICHFSFVSGCLGTSQTRILLIVIRICHSNNFSNWTNQSTSTIPKLNLKTKKQEKFRPNKYQIQSHFFLHIVSLYKKYFMAFWSKDQKVLQNQSAAQQSWAGKQIVFYTMIEFL